MSKPPNRPVLARMLTAQFEVRIDPIPTPSPPGSRNACQPICVHNER